MLGYLPNTFLVALYTLYMPKKEAMKLCQSEILVVQEL